MRRKRGKDSDNDSILWNDNDGILWKWKNFVEYSFGCHGRKM